MIASVHKKVDWPHKKKLKQKLGNNATTLRARVFVKYLKKIYKQFVLSFNIC